MENQTTYRNSNENLAQSKESKTLDAKTEVEKVARIQPQPKTRRDPIAALGRRLFTITEDED